MFDLGPTLKETVAEAQVPEFLMHKRSAENAARGLAETTAPWLKDTFGYESTERKMKRIASETDLSDGKAVQDTFNQLMSINPESAKEWLLSIKPIITENAQGSNDMSNLGKHFRDAKSIKHCAPGDKKCEQEALDLVMQFKKPESELMKGLGKGAADKIWDGLDKSEKARGSLIAIDSALGELDRGVIAGSFSGARQGIANFLYTAGLIKNPSIVNTQKFIADTGNLVLNILGSGDLGAGTGLSDKDVEFAKTVAGASTDLTPDALRRILDMNRRASERVIERHNKFAGSIDKEKFRGSGLQGVDVLVKIPKYRNIKGSPSNEGNKKEQRTYQGFILKSK